MITYRYLIRANDIILEVDDKTYKSYTGQRCLFSLVGGIKTLQVYRYPDCPFESYTIFEINKYDQLLPILHVRCSPNWPLAEQFHRYIRKH